MGAVPLTRSALFELAGLFLKLGTIGFGGPAAHIALMEDEVVRRRSWFTREEFLDLLGATNLIPGPNSTELAIYIGHRRAGWPGLFLAGSCFILPAVLIVLGCGWAYVRFNALPQAGALLYGIKPVIIAIIAQALWGLCRTAVKNKLMAVVAAAAALAAFKGANELMLLLAAGLLAGFARFLEKQPARLPAFVWHIPGLNSGWAAAVSTAPLAKNAVGLWPLFFFFLKVGSVLYGSGYVLLAFLRNGLVEKFGWLTESQLLDAIAIGQVTPGPLFTTATFAGYLVGGPPAALVATAGIFLPSFFFVAISGPFLPRLRSSPFASAFLDGVNAASLALMAVVTAQLTVAALVDWLAISLTIVSGVLLVKYRMNSAWLILGGGLIGLSAQFLTQ